MASRFQVIKCHKWQASRVNKKNVWNGFSTIQAITPHSVWKSLKKSPFFYFTTLRAKSKTIWIFAPKPQNFCLMRFFWAIFKHRANICLLRKDIIHAFLKEKVRLFSASFSTIFPSKFWVKISHLFLTKCECKLPSSPKCKECVRLGGIWVFFISGTPSLKIIDVTSTKWLSNKYRMVSLKI